jgi:hypothetical protein
MTMARVKRASGEASEYRNKATGETVGAYAGTEQDKVYAKDEDYERVSGTTEPEATSDDGEGGGDGEQPVDLDGLSRDQLNALAAERGVSDPADLPNKDAVKAAIAEATTEEEG